MWFRCLPLTSKCSLYISITGHFLLHYNCLFIFSSLTGGRGIKSYSSLSLQWVAQWLNKITIHVGINSKFTTRTNSKWVNLPLRTPQSLGFVLYLIGSSFSGSLPHFSSSLKSLVVGVSQDLVLRSPFSYQYSNLWRFYSISCMTLNITTDSQVYNQPDLSPEPQKHKSNHLLHIWT